MSSQENIARLSKIEQEIELLIQEGIRLAEEEKVTFDLSGTTFADEYGMGGYRYVPEDSTEAEERRKQAVEWFGEEVDDYPLDGWLTSSSDCD